MEKKLQIKLTALFLWAWFFLPTALVFIENTMYKHTGETDLTFLIRLTFIFLAILNVFLAIVFPLVIRYKFNPNIYEACIYVVAVISTYFVSVFFELFLDYPLSLSVFAFANSKGVAACLFSFVSLVPALLVENKLSK